MNLRNLPEPKVSYSKCSWAYSADQMKDHSRYVRWDALEEAAKLCESLACTDDNDSTITRLECAAKIRSLK